MLPFTVNQFTTIQSFHRCGCRRPMLPPRGNHTSVVGHGNQVNSPTVVVNNGVINNGPGAGSINGMPRPFMGGIGNALCGCGNILGGPANLFGGFGNILGGIGLPFLGSGSCAGNGIASSWSHKGIATASPFGSSVLSTLPGKSHSYNFGSLGSYASGKGGRALNILGLYSETRSGGNTSRDFSGLINAAGLGLLGMF